jgi:hypothetical protein
MSVKEGRTKMRSSSSPACLVIKTASLRPRKRGMEVGRGKEVCAECVAPGSNHLIGPGQSASVRQQGGLHLDTPRSP